MLLRCRATVFSLSPSSRAITRLVCPAATSRTTSTSRSVSPPGPVRGPVAPRGEPLHDRQVRRGPEAVEALAGGVELELGGRLVAQRAQAPTDEDPRLRRRHAECRAPPTPAGSRSRRPAPRPGARRPAGSRRSRAGPARAPTACRSRTRPAGARRRRRRPHRRPRWRVGRRRGRPAARSRPRAGTVPRTACRRLVHGGVGPPLGDPEPRKAGLGAPAQAVGAPVVLRGVVEVTHQAVDLAELVRRVTRAGPRSSRSACVASATAPAQSPPQVFICARCTRH